MGLLSEVLIPKYFHLFYQKTFKEPVLRHVRAFEESPWWPEERLRRHQWERLKKLLDHAYRNVPHYRRLFDPLGLRPEDIRSEEDWKKIPLLSRTEMRENPQDFTANDQPGAG